jgi:transposase-like protein
MLLAMSKRRDTAERWRDIFRRQAGSGLSVAAFCRRARIPQASFYAWRRKLREAASFAEVHVEPDPASAASALQMVLPGGRCIMVWPGFDRATLLALLDVLEQRPAVGAGVKDRAPTINGEESGA